jgi:hypothetical protein
MKWKLLRQGWRSRWEHFRKVVMRRRKRGKNWEEGQVWEGNERWM